MECFAAIQYFFIGNFDRKFFWLSEQKMMHSEHSGGVGGGQTGGAGGVDRYY